MCAIRTATVWSSTATVPKAHGRARRTARSSCIRGPSTWRTFSKRPVRGRETAGEGGRTPSPFPHLSPAFRLYHRIRRLLRDDRCRGLLRPARDQVGEVGEPVGRDGHHGRRLLQVALNRLVVGVGLGVVRVAIAALELVEVERGYAVRQEGEVVGAAFVAVHHRVRAEPRDGGENLAPQTVQVLATLQRLTGDRPPPVVQ